MKDIKDYLHLYLGCDTLDKDNNRSYLVAVYDDGVGFVRYANEAVCISFNRDVHKLILRPLSDMTEDECKYLAWFHMDSEKHLDADARITIEEVDTNIVYGDGGLMVDSNAAVVIEISCRCFEGQLCVRANGDLEMWSERGERLEMDRQGESVRYLLSKGFDIFNLIPEGLAIDKTKLTEKI